MFPLRDNIPSRRTPWMSYLLILSCVAVFIYQVSLPRLGTAMAFRPAYVLTVEGLSQGPLTIVLAALASMFMHGGLFHLISNMWFLWIFGDNVEDRMGHVPFLAFYLICGMAATGAQVVMTGLGADPQALGVPMVGASGAIAGVLAAYYRLFPRASVRTLVFIFIFITLIDVPAVLFILLWFILQVAGGLGSLGLPTGVAFWAHVGGFLAGLLLVRLFAPGRPAPPTPRVVHMRWE